jgi:hypothetical protein
MKSYPNATSYLCDFFEDRIENGDFNYNESTFLDTILRMSELIKVTKPDLSQTDKIYGKNIHSYEVHPLVAQVLVELAEIDESFYDCCAEICSLNILGRSSLAPPMLAFASRVLSGDITRPAKRSRPFKKNWIETSAMYIAALEVSWRFDLFLTRNDEGSNKFSACDAVAEALTICGRKTKYSEIKYLMVHPDKAKFRDQVNMMRKFNKRIEKTKVQDAQIGSDQNIFLLNSILNDVVDIAAAYFTDEQIRNLDS